GAACTYGATVAYGGDWRKDGLTKQLIDAPLPNRLRQKKVDEPRLEVYAMEPPGMPDPRVTVVMVSPPSAPNVSHEIRQAAHLFRMRWQSGARCRARILLSGRTEGSSGRMPGIIEEAMIAIALHQPIYVLGGFGGAAASLGELLGLSSTVRPPLPLKLAVSPRLDVVAHLFLPAGFVHLP